MYMIKLDSQFFVVIPYKIPIFTINNTSFKLIMLNPVEICIFFLYIYDISLIVNVFYAGGHFNE